MTIRAAVDNPDAPAFPRSRARAQVVAASSELSRDVNRDLVLELIRAMQPISRVDLARASGLQPSTISLIVEPLLEERWIRESAMVKTSRGRRPTLLSLNDNMVFLVADVRPAHATVALVDLNGHFLERKSVPLSRSPERSVERIAGTMQGMQQMYAARTFLGAGVSLPGRVDPATNRLMLALSLPWGDFPIRDRLQELLGLDVHLENAANASLLAELWFGRIEGIRNAMLVTVSEGVGVAILADGRLISGQNGLAGEFGHISLDPEGLPCACGAHGCWEQYASNPAALRYYTEPGPRQAATFQAASLSFPSRMELLSLAEDGDACAEAALSRQARAIGRGLSLINAILSPEVILLAGDYAAFFDRYLGMIADACREGAMDGVGPRVVSIGDGEVSRLRGAAAVVLQRHAGYYRAGRIRAGPQTGQKQSVSARHLAILLS